MNSPRSGTSALASSAVLALLLDVAVVMAFVVTGRGSHAEGLTVPGIVETAWPFLAALAVAWLITMAWQDPSGLRDPGLRIVFITVGVGVGIRALIGQGAPVSFIIVTALCLSAGLLGWRGVAYALRRRREERAG